MTDKKETKKKDLFKKLNAIMEEVGAIGKNQTNTLQKYNFRGIDDFLNALHPLFVKHGVMVIPKTLDIDYRETEIKKKGYSQIAKTAIERMEYTFINIDNPDERWATEIVGEGMDYSDKAVNKAHSAAQKYLLLQMFLVPTKDMAEADKESPEVKGIIKKELKNEEAEFEEIQSNEKADDGADKRRKMFYALLTDYAEQMKITTDLAKERVMIGYCESKGIPVTQHFSVLSIEQQREVNNMLYKKVGGKKQ